MKPVERISPDHSGHKHVSECRVASGIGAGPGAGEGIGQLYGLLDAETLDELATVLDRRKFDRYLDRESRRAFVALIRRHTLVFSVQRSDLATVDPPCRDPADNQFLALALVCEADALISSDDDLLTLDPWNGLSILAPAQFVASNDEGGPILNRRD